MKQAFCAILFLLGATASSAEPMKFPNSTDNKVLRDAFEFILNGDDGWGGGLYDGYAIEDCKITYGREENLFSRYRAWVVDLNLVKWNSWEITPGYTNKYELYNYPTIKHKCSGTCYVELFSKDSSFSKKSIMNVIERDVWDMKIKMRKGRFLDALKDIQSVCPGVKSY